MRHRNSHNLSRNTASFLISSFLIPAKYISTLHSNLVKFSKKDSIITTFTKLNLSSYYIQFSEDLVEISNFLFSLHLVI